MALLNQSKKGVKMRLRQAKKIMANVQKYPFMNWIYRGGRVTNANN